MLIDISKEEMASDIEHAISIAPCKPLQEIIAFLADIS